MDEDKRFRVISFYPMVFFGMLPLGSLEARSLASPWAAPSPSPAVVSLRTAHRLREEARPMDERLRARGIGIARSRTTRCYPSGRTTSGD